MSLLKHNWSRWLAASLAVVVLTGIYFFQNFDFSTLIGNPSPNVKFIFNKSVRFILNDSACLLLIMAIFNKYNYLRMSAWVFLVELFFFLPVYFVLKLSLEGDSEISSPLLSQLHRMIVNPLLMIVLIMGFLYQDYFSKKT